MAEQTDTAPVTPDELGPESPSSFTSSEASTPLDGPDPNDHPKRVPSLRSISDPNNMTPAISSSSSPLRVLANARNPRPSPRTSSSIAGVGAGNSVLDRVRDFAKQRQQMASPGSSPVAPLPSPMGPPGGLRLPMGAIRPGPGGLPRSAPAIQGVKAKPSLSERRNMKFPGMPSNNGPSRPGAPKLSDMQGGPTQQQGGGPQTTKMDDFKKYIDTDKGWITFDGAATITKEGVRFSNGHTFSISLDEIQLLDELGKGNYGTVYKVRHAKPRVPRFGPGLAGTRAKLNHTLSDPSPMRAADDESSDETSPKEVSPKLDGSTTGVIMAMKEIRLELDDAKFTTILKELVILHECISPYIIDFYGAFFQEGAVYICIEYMDGGSIDKLYDGGIPESVLRKITYSTVMGLKSLKDEHNIIHRDVKPTNILVNTRGQVKICDFGVSGNLVASIAKTNIGCQSYMAPERISGGAMFSAGNTDGTYSVQSDIWSLGLTIIECAMGRYPYPPEIAATIFSQLSAIVDGEPPNLPDEGFSDMARDFVKGCLNKTPAARPTYAMLLNHPWLAPLTKPQTIEEESEEEADGVDQAAYGVAGLKIAAGTQDEEVAAWVRGVLKKSGGAGGASAAQLRPALHAAPLDSVSPVASPLAMPQ